MNILSFEFKRHLKMTIFFALFLAIFSSGILFFYIYIKEDLDMMMEFFDRFPAPMKAMMGSEVSIVTKPLGLFSFIYSFISLIPAIQAIYLGLSIHGSPFSEKTSEFIFTKPASRARHFVMKVFSGFALLILETVFFIAVLALVLFFMGESDDSASTLLWFADAFLLTQVVFFALGTLLAYLFMGIKCYLSVSLGVAAFFFAISAFAVSGNTDKLKFLTPFQYHRFDSVLLNGYLDSDLFFFSLLIITVLFGISYFRLTSADVYNR